MIEVRGLTKRYGSEKAVDNISFEVQRGEVLGFLGPNGAGKTTTMKVITCYLPPSEGTVLVDGLDVRENTLDVRRLMGYLPEHTPLYHDMVTYDYLIFVAAMRGVPREHRAGRLKKMAEVCGIGDVLGKRIEVLSKGYRQRVGLAQALIHDPPILILDEPTTGLDPNQIVEIRELIKSIGREKTVILSTHILPEVQASCDRVLIIHRGGLVADGTPEDLQASFAGAQRVHFGIESVHGDVTSVLEKWGRARIAEKHAVGEGQLMFELVTDEKDDLRPDLFHLAVENGWTLTELHREAANLEDVFRQLTT
ncbi:MAG: ATP-binding cassette domain-containing protein [Rhodothermales bacterium]